MEQKGNTRNDDATGRTVLRALAGVCSTHAVEAESLDIVELFDDGLRYGIAAPDGPPGRQHDATVRKGMNLQIGSVTIGCTDPERLAAFWSAALGTPVTGASEDLSSSSDPHRVDRSSCYSG